jgi:hypothetical protein
MLQFPVEIRLICACLLILTILVSNSQGVQGLGLSYMKMAPIVWFSRSRPTVESSVFGSEFVAMKNWIYICRGIRYKLIMMGVTLSGPTYVYGYNMPGVQNTQRPESVLKKKSNSIFYHTVCESDAISESIIAHVPSVDNPADISTKVVTGGGDGIT